MNTKDIILNGIVVGSHEATGDNEKDAEAVQDFLKKKGLYEEVSINDSMYGQANAFAGVANELYAKGLKKSPFKGSCFSPFIVNATFSIELYIKTIHKCYGNKVRGHHLHSLYKGMPKKGKEHFLKSAIDIRPLYQLEDGTDIHKCLESLSKAFEEWRYIYEHDHKGTELQSIRYTMHVAHEACYRSRASVIKS